MDLKPTLPPPQRLSIVPAMPKIMKGKYQYLQKVGSGKCSIVYKTKDLVKDAIVAVKRICYETKKRRNPSAVTREISLLEGLDHDNIVRLLDVYPSEQEICLVFECMDCSLRSFFCRFEFTETRDPRVIKSIMLQILRGVAFCHSRKVLHRDLKPDNVLVDIQNLVVKISDFGISREATTPHKAYTPKLGTTRYMAPEMLLGCEIYSYPVDIWSVGCIFGEMVKGRKVFSGYLPINEQIKHILPDNRVNEQIQSIFRVLGTPNEETWPGVTEILPGISEMPEISPKCRTFQMNFMVLNQMELIFLLKCCVGIQGRELQLLMLLSIPISVTVDISCYYNTLLILECYISCDFMRENTSA